MLGAIIGDIVGSRFEGDNIKSTEFSLFTEESVFTDDTVLTIAVAESIMTKSSYGESIKKYARKYPYAGYGATFREWMFSESFEPYNSWGNGSAMRVSPVGFAFDDENTVMSEAKKSAEVTHNHPEGVKGAQAIAMSIFWARTGKDKEFIKKNIEKEFGYDLNRRIDEIRPIYRFDVSCQGSVPEAIIAFLESKSYENAIRLAISIGGDSDTIACIAGGIAEAYYKEIPREIIYNAKKKLPISFIEIIDEFYSRYKMNLITF